MSRSSSKSLRRQVVSLVVASAMVGIQRSTLLSVLTVKGVPYKYMPSSVTAKTTDGSSLRVVASKRSLSVSVPDQYSTGPEFSSWFSCSIKNQSAYQLYQGSLCTLLQFSEARKQVNLKATLLTPLKWLIFSYP